MKKIYTLLLTVIILFSTSVHCFAVQRFDNYPLKASSDTLRILAVGNSFSDDGTEYLPALLHAAGLDNVIVARLYIGGCSLETHCKGYANDSHNYLYSKAKNGKWTLVDKHYSLKDGLQDEKWDIITLQETSGLSGIYANYQEWLPQLISIVRAEARNSEASIVWHETWSYARNSKHGSFSKYDRDSQKMLDGIRNCVSNLKTDYNIPIVIPTGEAIALARESRLNNAGRVPDDSPVYDLTRDGYHLNRQFGRYIAACVWFETLIRPTMHISIKDNPYLLEDTEFSITKTDAKLCRKIAIQATHK